MSPSTPLLLTHESHKGVGEPLWTGDPPWKKSFSFPLYFGSECLQVDFQRIINHNYWNEECIILVINIVDWSVSQVVQGGVCPLPWTIGTFRFPQCSATVKINDRDCSAVLEFRGRRVFKVIAFADNSCGQFHCCRMMHRPYSKPFAQNEQCVVLGTVTIDWSSLPQNSPSWNRKVPYKREGWSIIRDYVSIQCIICIVCCVYLCTCCFWYDIQTTCKLL